ncbi:glycosyltransferase [Aerococcus urinaeequi]|uniref:glycosyltransferase n=1 Tax=Aerococcus urinaeequi TaxID=51665 RepID=UPI003D6B1ED9
MIRVLHVVTAMDRGGLETLIMNIYRKIERTKIQFDFLTHSDNKHDFDDEILSLGGKIYSVPGRRKGILNNKKALENFFSSHPEYKIVHNHLSSLSYIEPLKVAKKYNVPIRIIHSHSTQQSGLKINKYLHFLNRRNIEYYANYFFAVSEKAAYWLYGKK